MNNNNNNMEVWSFEVLQGISTIIGGGIFTGVCGWVFIKAADSITRIVIIPFLICGLAVLIKGIVALVQGLNLRKGMNDDNVSAESVLDKHEKLNIADKIFSKLYMVGFLLFWFGFLIVFDYFAIKQGQMSMLAFSLIFWVVGIYVAIKDFKG